jgi:hypothetical protein
MRPYFEKKTSRVTQVVELLPHKCEALSSSPSAIKKKNQVIYRSVFGFVFETGSYYVAKVDLEPEILPLQPPECWDCRYEIPYLAMQFLKKFAV